MSSQHFPTKYFLITIVASALVASVFGFVAGIFASSSQFSGLLIASVPSVLRRVLPQPSAETAPKAEEQPKAQIRVVTEESATIDAVKKASPAVVSIVISKNVPTFEQYFYNPFGDNDLFDQFFGENLPQFQIPQYRQKGTERREVGAGSGFLVSSDGYIITNKHVVADQSAEYTAILSDGRKFPAKVLARDPSNDIAVIKIDAKDLPMLPLGDSDSLQVGQHVIAIGYALGRFGNTVSTGVVSGLQRSITAGDGVSRPEDLFDVIQTDAAINPGNSGGPLLDLFGKVVGVNVAIVQGSQNIGFALPIDDVKKVYESVKAGGKIVRPFLGVRYVLITKELMEQNQLPVDYGALVLRGDRTTDLAILPGSPADKAGIVENDIILEVDGKKIDQNYPLAVAIRKYSVGDTIKLKIFHQGQQKEVSVVLTEKK